MSKEYLNRIPLNDIDLNDMSMLADYSEKFNNNQFSDAIKILDDSSFESGVRASVLNKIRTDIIGLETDVLNIDSYNDTHYSVDEPTDDDMQNKIFWGKPKYGYYLTFSKTNYLTKKDDNGNLVKDENGNLKTFEANTIMDFKLMSIGVPMCLLKKEEDSEISYFLVCLNNSGDLEELKRIFDYTYTCVWVDDNATDIKYMEDYIYDVNYGEITKTNLAIFSYTDDGKQEAIKYLLSV